jgi:hypothetical protein
MLDRTGIGVDDLAWIHRDQFVHYLTVAQATDPCDWPSFRLAVSDALAAALGLDDNEAEAALAVVDQVHGLRDPVSEWHEFLGELWRRRRAIRADLD